MNLILSVAGLSMIQVCRQIQITHEDHLTESGRQRARGTVKRTLFHLFRQPKPHYQSLTTIEDVEVRPQTDLTPFPSVEGKILMKSQQPPDLAYGIDIRFLQSPRHNEKVLESCRKPNPGRGITLEVVGRSFNIHDTSGNPRERKELMSSFQDVDTFMFTVSLISYSQPSWQDTNTVRIDMLPFNHFERLITFPKNLMQDYLTLFESISKSSGLRNVPIIILFNNWDLLSQRMEDFPVTDYYPDYSGSLDPSFACRYFAGKFDDLDRAGRLNRIYVTNKVEQDDEDLECTVDNLCPELFPRRLMTVVELPE